MGTSITLFQGVYHKSKICSKGHSKYFTVTAIWLLLDRDNLNANKIEIKRPTRMSTWSCTSLRIIVGANFFLLFFVFSLTFYRVFFFFSLSGISLITLLCYVLYVNFVIVCYLALFLPVYVSISVKALVEVDIFSSVALTTNPVILSIW